MTAKRPRLLITRPQPAADRFAADAEHLGFEPLIEPLLTIRAEPGPFPELNGAQAVLLTSAAAAAALAAAWGRRTTPLLAVGDATAAAARKAGFEHVISADGDGAALAALACARLDPAAGPVIHASGADKAVDLAGLLRAGGFEASTVILYKARTVEALSAAARGALLAGTVAYAAFFSPRTARTFVRLSQKAGIESKLTGVTAAALSPNVRAPLGALAWRRLLTADQPTAAALLETLAASTSDAAPGNGAGQAG